jgi:dipeptidyl aminopeptidase/acylaminoacyl peptidase
VYDDTPFTLEDLTIMLRTAQFLLVILLAASAPTVAAENSHPFGFDDLISMERVSSPVPSPDGRWVAFELRTYSLEENKSLADLWLVATDGGSVPRQLTTHKASDHGATWHPGSRRLAFLSSRSGSSQIWEISMEGGEARQVTDLPVDVESVRWSPDGKHLAFSASVYVDCEDLACTSKRDEEKEESGVKAYVFDHLLFRHWDRWEDGKRSHLFVIGADGVGDPVDLMKGMDADSPTIPFGGREEYAWSPAGDALVFTAKTAEHPERNTDYDLFRSRVSGGEPERITPENRAWDTGPAFSPDGVHLAYLAMSRPGYEADRFEIILYDPAAGTRRSLTEGWDRSVGSLAWTPDSRALVVTANDQGHRKIFRVDVGDGAVTELRGRGFHGGVSVLPDSRLVFAHDSLTAPAEIWTAAADGSDAQALTRFNAGRLEAAERSEPREFWFEGAGGDRIHGWFLEPAGFEPGKKHSLVYLIHGGPQGSWLDHFHYRWNAQMYAGAGHAVAMVDFHGSTGYGQAFTDSINRDWGGKPYEDLMKGLDHVLESHDWLDPERVCAAGASYGGYMINWIEGQTDRFRCLVNHDGLFSLRGMYYSTEELWFPEWDMGGPPWEADDMYRKWSPETYVDRWKTPMLVIHGARDYRIVDGEGLSAFTALQRRGIESKLLYFPDENHWVLKPKNMKLWNKTVLGWLEKFLLE